MTTSDLLPLLKKYPTTVAGLLVAIVCGVVVYLRWDEIGASETELDARSSEASKVSANVRNAANLAEQVAEMQGYTKDVDSRLLKASQLAVNLQYFYKLEAETEVKLADIRQNAADRANKGQFVPVPFSVTVQGTFQHVANFLTRLQNGRHFCRISAATVSKAGGGTETNASADAADITLSLTLDLLGQP